MDSPDQLARLVEELNLLSEEHQSYRVAGLCLQAATLITTLSTRVEALTQERDEARRDGQIQSETSLHWEQRALTAEAALEPFAAIATVIAAERPGWDHDDFTFGMAWPPLTFRMADFRRARAARLQQGTTHAD